MTKIESKGSVLHPKISKSLVNSLPIERGIHITRGSRIRWPLLRERRITSSGFKWIHQFTRAQGASGVWIWMKLELKTRVFTCWVTWKPSGNGLWVFWGEACVTRWFYGCVEQKNNSLEHALICAARALHAATSLLKSPNAFHHSFSVRRG